jgi:hypothetical protein
VSAGGARRGRRDNGLDAAEYAVAGDVDPRVGEHLLDVLAAGGIAAYLQPASDLNPVTRTTTMPSRPTDRLFVDRAHLATARDYLSQLAADDDPAGAATETGRDPAGANAPDVEAEWARIIAGFHAEVDPADRPWPAAEHLDAGDNPDRPRRGPGAAGAQGPDDPTARRRRRTDYPPGDGTGGTLGPPAAGPLDRADPLQGRSLWDRPAETDGDAAPGARPIERRRRIRPTTPDEPSLLDALDTFGTDLPDEPTDDEGYTPPPRLPRRRCRSSPSTRCPASSRWWPASCCSSSRSWRRWTPTW